jgi:hypothetical protein
VGGAINILEAFEVLDELAVVPFPESKVEL